MCIESHCIIENHDLLQIFLYDDSLELTGNLRDWQPAEVGWPPAKPHSSVLCHSSPRWEVPVGGATDWEIPTVTFLGSDF